jgi:hypothetical protein
VGQGSSSYRSIRTILSPELLGLCHELRFHARRLWNSTISLLSAIRRSTRSYDSSRYVFFLLNPHDVSNLLQVQVRVLVLPGKLPNNIHLTAVKPCLVRPCLDKVCPDKVCLVRDCLDRECLVMVCLARAMARCQEAQVGMAVVKRPKSADGIRVSLLRTTAMDTRATKARHLRLLEQQIHSGSPWYSRFERQAAWWRIG